MKFMKSQMFVSLRRKNGEDHLEILSDDEEDFNNQWCSQITRKQEGGSDTMDDYEAGEQYETMFKYEQMLQHVPQIEMDETQDGEEEEEDEQQQQSEEQEEREQEEMSPIPSMQDQEELTALQQQQAELGELRNISNIQQQPVITSDLSTTMGEMVGIPTSIVTTTASSLSDRLTNMQQRSDLSQRLTIRQRASDLGASLNIQQPDRHSEIQQSRDMNGSIAEIDARHSALHQQRAAINNRINTIQRSAEMSAMHQRAEMSAMHQRAEISALHERAEMTAMQQRSEMQQRNGVENGVGNSNVSPMISDDRGGISDDYHFFMSLMPHVRHFTSLQKLKVRNRIQQIIIEEASNCQYDPLAN